MNGKGLSDGEDSNGMMTAKAVQAQLRSLSNPDIAAHCQRFFKTGKGGYGEGDEFLGIRVPVLRAHAKIHADLGIDEIGKLLKSPFHEERLFALLLLVSRFSKSEAPVQKDIYEFYLRNTRYINNWDLVDCSAHKVVGEYLKDKSRDPLYGLAVSDDIWERRIAVISTLQLIKLGDFKDLLKISEILLQDDEDLIHKAVGWMLREVGNRDRKAEEDFLQKHYQDMPRTMLRYAIEKFPEELRQSYLNGRV